MADANPTEEQIGVYGEYCSRLLMPIAGVVSVPGLLFVGGVIGTKAVKFAIAPSVAISGGASIPLWRPYLGYYRARDGIDKRIRYRLPKDAKTYVNLITSLNVGVGGFLYPGTMTTTDLGFSVGGYFGLEVGAVAFEEGGVRSFVSPVLLERL